ncbi:hypothetical protein [Nocardioides solisilvae]|uniref:hypothetical protein n=1 Tax=Nocardioides solisilvae TaxID=1542435 RepID=UPI000D74AC61|nr:hypothetical protein [Nocardioides solisilvae]
MRHVRRLGLGVIDQGLSSISNVLFLVAVAREAGVDEFGAVSFAYALFAFGLAVQRASMGTLISLSAGRRVPPPVLVSLLWGVLMGALGVVLGQVVGDGGSAAYYVVVGACLVVYPQDLLRYSVIAERRVGLAVVSDGVWVAVTVGLFGASVLGVDLDATTMTLVWVVLGGGAALLAILVPLLRGVSVRLHWLSEHAHELRTLGPDAFLGAVAPLVLAAVMAHFMTFGDVAAVRGAGTLLGPAAMLFSALPVVLLPEMARVLGDDRSRLAVAQAVAMALLVLGWGGVLALLPDGVGGQVLGETWSASRAILLWVVLEMVMWAFASGPIAFLGTYRRWRTLLLARVVYLTAVGCALAATVWTGDLTKVMVGMLLASVVNCAVLTAAARRESSRPGEQAASPAG